MAGETQRDDQKSRVMIVEDEGIIARDIERTLERLGYEVTGHAGSGGEALELASLVRSDLILMDIKIRGSMDGVETAAQIRSLHGIPVVFLTAHADNLTLSRANETEPYGYVVKPFSENSLKVAIEVALKRHSVHLRADEYKCWLSTALESIGDALVTTDFDGRIRFMNATAEQFTGWSLSDAQGLYYSKVIQLQSLVGESMEEAQLGVAPECRLRFGQARLTGRDGCERTVVGSIAPMRRPDTSESLGSVILLRDVAAFQKRREVPAQRLDEVSYVLSHDLREPVRNMGCFAQMLDRSASHDALSSAERDYLRMIVDAAKRMDTLLLGLHKFHQSGRIRVPRGAKADSAACLRSAWATMAALAKEVGAELDCGALPIVRCTPEALTEIFTHLLSNAIKFRSDRPLRIFVSAEQQGKNWSFFVEDNGVGVRNSQTERIFLLFKKVHEADCPGSGIGLSICRRIVEQFGGRIWAESKVGSGSQFFFTLPGGHDAVEPANSRENHLYQRERLRIS